MKIRFIVFPLDNSPGYIITRTATQMKTGLYQTSHAKGFKITSQQSAVPNKHWETEGLHQTELAERTFKDRHTMTRVLNLMEENGLVRRESDPKGSKCYSIYLTEEGKVLKNKLTPFVFEHLGKAFAGLTEKDVRELRRIYEHILKNLEAPLKERPLPPL